MLEGLNAMEQNALRQEIDKLPLSEKILLVEDIWDSVARDNRDLPLPEWQKQELDKRYTDYREGRTTLHDWQEVHESLRNSVR
jgi:putative addiction module component (TIGR02574 family)